MKKVLGRLGIVFVVLILMSLAGGIYWKLREKSKSETRLSSISPVVFSSLGGEQVTEEHAAGRPLWLIFFQSDCDFCNAEVEDIRKSNGLDEVSIWLVSAEPIAALSSFSSRYSLDTLAQTKVLHDFDHLGYRRFGVQTFPVSFLYDSNGRLVKQYKGVTKPETVLQDLNLHNR